MDNTTIAIIQGLITIFSTGAVGLVLRQQIKSQKEQIDAMKSNIESMQAFVNIFDINEIKKFNELSIHNAKIEAIEENEQQIISRVMKDLKNKEFVRNIISDNLNQNQILLKNSELIAGISLRLMKIQKSERDKIIETTFPNNKEQLNEMFAFFERQLYNKFEDD